jgi:hypothetical protein
MTSILKVDNLQDSSGSGSPYIKDAVLQVKQGILTTKWTSSSSLTAFENTPLSVTITPQSTNSKILITGMINFNGTAGDHIDFKVVRNGTDFLLSTETMGNRTKSHIHYHVPTAQQYQIQTAPLNLLDEPSSTSALTYTLQAATPYSAAFQAVLNTVDPGADYDASYNAYTVSTITAMEIGG